MDWQQQQQQQQYYEEEQRRRQQDWENSQKRQQQQQESWYQRHQEEQRRYQEDLLLRQQQRQQLQDQQQRQQQEEQQRQQWQEKQQRRQRSQSHNQPIQSSFNYHSPSSSVSVDSSPTKSSPYRSSSRFGYRSLVIRTKKFMILGVVAGGLYATNSAYVDRTIHDLYRDHQETIAPIITPVQPLWQQFYSGFILLKTKSQPLNSSASHLASEEKERKQALNAAIAQAKVDRATFLISVDKLFAARHPELAGRSLTTHSNDANLRREWDELAKSQLKKF